MQRVADRSLAEDRMQLMLHRRQNKRREQQKDAERPKQLLGLRGDLAPQDYQMQLKILKQQEEKQKLMELLLEHDEQQKKKRNLMEDAN